MNAPYRHHPQLVLPIQQDIIVDNFAGGGGASTGIEAALGRQVDIAINHNPDAIDMHTVNHPLTQHYCESVWDVDPVKVCQGRPVSLAWFSPDCKHFSRAKGKKPVDKNIRGLAWVAMRWAGTVKPHRIMLENVEEFEQWGPLVTDQNGDMVPCTKRKGFTFKSFVRNLERRGYQVDFQTLVASDYGAPTSRKRLFMVARSDGGPLNWPEPTHGTGPGLKPYKTAADIIDWSLPCPSIFERKRPLAENTLRRIARGIQKFVIDSPEPFIMSIANTGWDPSGRQYGLDRPLTTIQTKAEHCLVVPSIQRQFGNSIGSDITDPLGTITAGGGGKSALLASYIQPYYGDKAPIARGRTMGQPLATQTTENRFSLCSAFLKKHNISNICQLPLGDNSSHTNAFLIKYYSEGGQWQSLHDPLHTIPTKDRIGLVMVKGEPYQIVDIGMRMLQPHELYAAQGFPADYQHSHRANGKAFTKKEQVAMVGNSVPPPMAEALVRANMTSAIKTTEQAA